MKFAKAEIDRILKGSGVTDPELLAVVRIGLEQQHRFKAEPTFGPTGVGFLAPSDAREFTPESSARKSKLEPIKKHVRIH
ncbi:hypothetical protein Ga0100231_018385 [Opitutaceae bacterium TAV4]|nr:hypothetical protein Ga0100231_018385 [Opitutaceae bacterium TAV4]RRK00092.1 hypothetical protein Ga0100230_019090 [Opitutaceae bacterium TAV3]